MTARLAPWLLVLTAACSSTPSSTPPSTSTSDAPVATAPTTSPTSTTTSAPGATGAATPPATASTSPAAPTGAETACKADADCVFVVTTCCDVCNGGSQVAVNSSAADAVKARTRGQLDCAHHACTMRACLNPPKPACRAGVCTAS